MATKFGTDAESGLQLVTCPEQPPDPEARQKGEGRRGDDAGHQRGVRHPDEARTETVDQIEDRVEMSGRLERLNQHLDVVERPRKEGQRDDHKVGDGGKVIEDIIA